MLQYIFIHVEASNTMDQKPSHPKNMCKIMHKTVGGSTQHNIGSKTKNFQGTTLDPIKWGYEYTSNVLWPPPL